MIQPAIFEQLPSELYGDIVDHLPEDKVHQNILSLTRALPRASIPLNRLFEHIHLRSAQQVVLFYLRIKRDEKHREYVQTLSLENWQADADVVVNLLALSFPKLRQLRLFIGPNFEPDHLEEIFGRPIEGLELLSLRFRPYVQRATYYQFMAGAYFDSTLFALCRWPTSSLPKLSIIQDPLDPAIAPTNKFAQPFVFHRLDPFSTLCRAPSVATLPYFRLRIPSRQISRFIYTPQQSFPALQLLDLSTCDIRPADVEAILGRFSKLEHLILDKCNLVTQRDVPEGAVENQWTALGKIMALAGVKRSKDREKKLRLWLEVVFKAAGPETNEAAAAAGTSKAKRGRKGLATATISLRELPQAEQVPTFVPQSVSGLDLKPGVRVRILPPKPRLLSLAASLPAHANITQEGRDGIRAEFEQGWAQGISQLLAIRSRLKTSWYNGTAKIVRLADPDENDDPLDDNGGDGEYGLQGLQDVEDEEMFSLGMEGDRFPKLCLAGSSEGSGDHLENCGHVVGRQVWADEL